MMQQIPYTPAAQLDIEERFRLQGLQGLVKPAPRKVHVILPDNHSEGLGAPIAAFLTKTRADQAMALLKHSHASFKLVEVEIQDA